MTGPLPLDVIGGSAPVGSAPAGGAAASTARDKPHAATPTTRAMTPMATYLPGGMGGASFGATSAPILRNSMSAWLR
ncbi:Uncharacterised protein [Mycobacterium tuberculosis]|nr:Uncharacterised protein [Mycobacterium tuberculosis]